jgi:hypothetical protein
MSFRFQLNGVETIGMAVRSILRGDHGNWNLRVVLLPAAGDRIAAGASYKFDRRDPMGRRPCGPVYRCTSIGAASSTLTKMHNIQQSNGHLRSTAKPMTPTA